MSLYQSNLKEDKGLIKLFECVISGYEVGNEVEKQLKELQSTAHLKGFRKGKAPMNIIQDSYFGKVFFDVINKYANNIIAEIAQKNNFKLASSPKVSLDAESSMPADRNIANIRDVKVEITYEILPEMNNVDFAKIDVKKYELNVTEADVQFELERVAKNFSEKEEKSEGVIQNGDVAVIDFTGYESGIPFEGGKAENHHLEIGSNSFIEGFEEGLVGVKSGEEKTLELKFPEQYHQENLAGKNVEFKVLVKKVLQQIPSQINDDLAKKFGFENLDALKEDIIKSLKANYENNYKNKHKEDIFKQLQLLLDFEVPPSMLERAQAHISTEENAETKQDPIANARLSIFLMQYANQNTIEVSHNDFMRYIESMARMYGQNPRAIFDIYEKNSQMKESVYNLLFETKIYEHIFNAINVETKLVSKQEFDDILKA